MINKKIITADDVITMIGPFMEGKAKDNKQIDKIIQKYKKKFIIKNEEVEKIVKYLKHIKDDDTKKIINVEIYDKDKGLYKSITNNYIIKALEEDTEDGEVEIIGKDNGGTIEPLTEYDIVLIYKLYNINVKM